MGADAAVALAVALPVAAAVATPVTEAGATVFAVAAVVEAAVAAPVAAEVAAAVADCVPDAPCVDAAGAIVGAIPPFAVGEGCGVKLPDTFVASTAEVGSSVLVADGTAR